MSFDCPGKGDDADIQTRMIMQVWTQAVTAKVELASLTAYESTMFCVRTQKFPNTLYISPTAWVDQCPLLMWYCWLAVADSVYDHKEFQLPDPKTDHWPGTMEGYAVGGINRALEYSTFGQHQEATMEQQRQPESREAAVLMYGPVMLIGSPSRMSTWSSARAQAASRSRQSKRRKKCRHAVGDDHMIYASVVGPALQDEAADPLGWHHEWQE
ncbi:predicted protein [Postia placenta Mad-698-R]|uniref:Uncharacterized protein n=1 Tax=Postia placenta MAD-698-R-SB12 TaxID=670580 RepID=A0A1X6MM95_9APHY|nr:hypothetical protein POSPLADRAFT_1050121 [Postia placenta MAD-698-R-SB12]EED78994.1 predicted protein [Postia placenta Mad-698-R]OSX57485.1 hypothetical protein POSPLADRAFT_1050121 [Postia placenta MAD-698-R-SB12]